MQVTALGVVPARGGSKAVPGKNIRPVLGVPLLIHTINSARRSTLLTRIVVSTDSEEIAGIAERTGVEVVMRPSDLATDESPTEDALIHALEAINERPDYVVTLEPTSPLRSPKTIDTCLELAETEGANAVFTVVETRAVLGRLEGNSFRFLRPGEPRRRQDRPPLYRESSTVYVTRTSWLLEHRSVIADPMYAVVVSEEEAIDINAPIDFLLAEAALRAAAGEAP